MITLHLSPEAAEWFAQQFELADVQVKQHIDPQADLEQQLADLDLLSGDDL